MTMNNYEDMVHKYYPTGFRVEEEILDQGPNGWDTWLVGSWDGPYGSARLITFLQPDGFQGTSIYFNHEGYQHTRRWPTRFGRKTLARLAREFMEEVYIKCKVKHDDLDDLDLIAIKTLAIGGLEWAMLGKKGYTTKDGLTEKGELVKEYL